MSSHRLDIPCEAVWPDTVVFLWFSGIISEHPSIMVVELASLVIRWMIMGKLVSLHFYVQKKVNVTPHRDFGRTKGAMHEEVFVQHLAHYKSLHPSVCVYLLLASWLVVALSMLLSSTVTGGKKPIMATVQRYSSQVSLETGWPKDEQRTPWVCFVLFLHSIS